MHGIRTEHNLCTTLVNPYLMRWLLLLQVPMAGYAARIAADSLFATLR